MKIVLLAVLFGLACGWSNIDYQKVTGEWYSVAIASEHFSRVAPGGDLRVYFRHLECLDEQCKELKVTFYAQPDGECKKFEVVGKKNEDGVFIGDYSGKNYFSIVWQKNDVLYLHNVNKDEGEKKTNVVLVVGKRKHLTEEEQSKLVDLLKEKKIPVENTRLIAKSDPCPK